MYNKVRHLNLINRFSNGMEPTETLRHASFRHTVSNLNTVTNNNWGETNRRGEDFHPTSSSADRVN